MSNTSELLFEYLRNLLYEEEAAVLDIAQLDDDYQKLGEGILYLGTCLKEARAFARDLAKGNLSVNVPLPSNEIASELKSLQAALKHVSWQTMQVAQGDYNQNVDFMGEFSEAFNTMIRQLDQRQRALEAEIETSRQKTLALENSNSLMQAITNEISQWIFVVDGETDEILFVNRTAKTAMALNKSLNEELCNHVLISYNNGICGAEESREWCVALKDADDVDIYFSVNSYPIHWRERQAVAHVMKDISAERQHLKLLENYAYKDPLTNMRNRFYGMQTLREWVEGKREFCICFTDLDNLKYVNDNFGHSEGDKYIIHAAGLLSDFTEGAISCRLGGDEFMVLAPKMTKRDCEKKLEVVRKKMQKNQSEMKHEYLCSISYGVVAVVAEQKRTAGELLAIADERMYQFKRSKKLGQEQVINS